MIHVAFTVVDRRALVIVKDHQLTVIHRETVSLGSAIDDIVSEWLACRAAVRLAGKHGKGGSLKLYSDSEVLVALQSIPSQRHDPNAAPGRPPKSLEILEPRQIDHGWGRNPGPPEDGRNRERTLYFDTVGMLVTLFPGRWEVVRVGKERIVDNGA